MDFAWLACSPALGVISITQQVYEGCEEVKAHNAEGHPNVLSCRNNGSNVILALWKLG